MAQTHTAVAEAWAKRGPTVAQLWFNLVHAYMRGVPQPRAWFKRGLGVVRAWLACGPSAAQGHLPWCGRARSGPSVEQVWCKFSSSVAQV
eukprot:853344-Pyramimonas_sp.AAC.1